MLASQTLREVRRAQGRSLREVARKAEIDPGALSRIERGLREPRTRTLRRICAALGLDRAESLLATFAPEEGD
jgi:transcriptional regulator with XRE-family HTH domain